MSIDRFRYELRIIGKWMIFIPILIMLVFALLAELLINMHVDTLRISQVLTASLEMILPLAASVIVATIISNDPVLELQLSMPKKYYNTAFGRLSLIVGWIACIELFSSVFIYHLKFLRIPAQLQTWGVLSQVLIEQLTWLAPLLWLVALSCCLALLIHSRTASSALLGAIWLIETLFYGYFVLTNWLKPVFLFPTTLAPYINFWLLNRLELCTTALVLLLLGWLLLHNPQPLLQDIAGEE